eukprot:Gb_30966 [translate_table: standard]
MVPIQVLQSARAEFNRSRLEFTIEPENQEPAHYRVFLYFQEVLDDVHVGQRVFDIYANGELQHQHFDILGNGTSKNRLFDFQIHSVGKLKVSLEGTSGKFGPICSAYEVYQIMPRSAGTVARDVDALVRVRDVLLQQNPNLMNLQHWSGDPCLPMSEDGQPKPWEGVNCSSHDVGFIITELDLSSKGLQGPIPSAINELANLEKLNLSYNHFKGRMPELSALSRLALLDIRSNELKGSIPESLARLPNLTTLLIGCNAQQNVTLPPDLMNQSKLHLDYGMCQNQLGPTGSTGQDQRYKVFIGGFVGGSFFIVIGVVVFFGCFYKRHAKVDRSAQSMPKYIAKSIPEAENLALKSFNIEMFTLQGLELATNNYESMIGEGGFGIVYRGTLADGHEVAVKVRSATSIQGTREFKTELNLLSEIRHENLVPLLGFCSEKDQQILVYPFMSNGSLQDRLYGEAAKRKPLDWQTRLSIALGAARGLHFLHTGGERCIIHRDVKSSNILLDHSMVAKVADFGFSKYAPQEGDSIVSLEVRGTAGYLDPEYYSSQQLTVKSDVFSFGVVLLEIICGREPLNIHRPRAEWSLVEWAKPFIQESNIDAVVDPVISTSYTPEAMWRIVEIALTSVEHFSVHRPSMEDIVRELEDALIIENNASQYMKSIESFGSSRFPPDPKVVPPLLSYQNNPSPVFSETLGSPHPR